MFRQVGTWCRDHGDCFYSVNDCGPAAIEAVYDGGALLTFAGDECCLVDLMRAEIQLGHYRTCSEIGMIRLGAYPIYVVTADVVTENPNPPRLLRGSELAGVVSSARREALKALRRLL